MNISKLLNMKYIIKKKFTLILTFLPVIIYSIYQFVILLNNGKFMVKISLAQFHSAIISILLIPLFDIFNNFTNKNFPKSFPWSEIIKSFSGWKVTFAALTFFISLFFLITSNNSYLFDNNTIASIFSCIMFITSVLLLDYYNDEIFEESLAIFLHDESYNKNGKIAFKRRK